MISSSPLYFSALLLKTGEGFNSYGLPCINYELTNNTDSFDLGEVIKDGKPIGKSETIAALSQKLSKTALNSIDAFRQGIVDVIQSESSQWDTAEDYSKRPRPLAYSDADLTQTPEGSISIHFRKQGRKFSDLFKPRSEVQRPKLGPIQ